MEVSYLSLVESDGCRRLNCLKYSPFSATNLDLHQTE